MSPRKAVFPSTWQQVRLVHKPSCVAFSLELQNAEFCMFPLAILPRQVLFRFAPKLHSWRVPMLGFLWSMDQPCRSYFRKAVEALGSFQIAACLCSFDDGSDVDDSKT